MEVVAFMFVYLMGIATSYIYKFSMEEDEEVEQADREFKVFDLRGRR